MRRRMCGATCAPLLEALHERVWRAPIHRPRSNATKNESAPYKQALIQLFRAIIAAVRSQYFSGAARAQSAP